MKSARALLVGSILIVLGFLCGWFGYSLLLGGNRAGFVASYIAFVAVSATALASRFYRFKNAIRIGAIFGLLGPTIALAMIAGVEWGLLGPDEKFFRSMASAMAYLWYPGNWVSSLLGVEARLHDLHLTRSAELYEWLRAVPMNSAVCALLAVLGHQIWQLGPVVGPRK